MKFEDALPLLRQGAEIRRESWSKTHRLVLNDEREIVWRIESTSTVGFANTVTTKHADLVALEPVVNDNCNCDGFLYEDTPVVDSADYFADDWEVVAQ